jgi:talin
LKFYNITSGTELEYKKMHRVLKIQLMDESKKAVLIDSSKPIRDNIVSIGEKVMVKDMEEYALRRLTAAEGDWLDPDKTLYEEDIGDDEVLLFAKRFFANDFNVDMNDPMQLHLIYVQASNAVVSGKYDPLQRREVIDLAARILQATYGNHDPNKHKPGFIELAKIVPLMWRKDKKIEKDVLKEHQKLVGTSDITAKFRFVQIVRSLKTYGITFFDCVEQLKTKKKGERMLLGITRDKIVKMNFETREVVKEWPIEQLRRWAATSNSFTLDFGDWNDDYFVVKTEEGEQMSKLIAGYIDLILKTQTEANRMAEEDDAQEAQIGNVAMASGTAYSSVTQSFTAGVGSGMAVPNAMNLAQQVPGASRIGGMQGYSVGGVGSGIAGMSVTSMAYPLAQKLNVVDISSALSGVKTLNGEMVGGLDGFASSGNLTADQWRDQLATYQDGVSDNIAKLLAQARMGAGDFDLNAIDSTARTLHQQMLGLAVAAKNIASLEGDLPLLNGARAVSESIARLLGHIDQHKDSPGSALAMELLEAEKSLQATILALTQARQGRYADKGAELLMFECVGDIASNLDALIDAAGSASIHIQDPGARANIEGQVGNAKVSRDWLIGTANSLVPVVVDPNARTEMQAVTTSIYSMAGKLVGDAKSAGITSADQSRLDTVAGRLGDALRMLVACSNTAEHRGADGDLDLDTPSSMLVVALSQIRKNLENPKEMIGPTKTCVSATNSLATSTKRLADASDPAVRDRLLKAAKNLTETMQTLMDSVRTLNKNPGDEKAKTQVIDSASRLESYGQDIVTDAGATAAVAALRYWSKAATGKMVKCITMTHDSLVSVTDETTRQALLNSCSDLNRQIDAMVRALNAAIADPENAARQEELLNLARVSIPAYHGFVVTSKRTQKFITDLNKKQAVSYAGDEAGDSIKKLEKACKVVSDLGGQTEIEEAMADFDAAQVDLDSAEFAASQGLLAGVPGQTREAGQELLALATRSLNGTLERLVDASRTGGKLPTHIKDAAAAVGQLCGAARSMASTVTDRPTQKRVIAAAKEVTADTMQLISTARVLIVDRQDQLKQSEVGKDHTKVKSSIASLIAAGKGLDARELDEAMAMIRAEVLKISNTVPTAANYKQASEALTSVAKALSAAASQLVGMARSNPRGVGSAAKIVSSTMVQLFTATSVAASAASEATVGEEVLKNARNLTNAMLSMFVASKDAAANRDAASIDLLNGASKDVTDAIQGLIVALGSATSPECEEAVQMIQEAIAKLGTTEGVTKRSPPQLLTEFSASTQGLSSVAQRIVTAARVSTVKLGMYAKECAVTIQNLVDSARSSSIAEAGSSSGASSGSPVTKLSQDLQRACQTLIQNPKDNATLMAAVKTATAAGKELLAIGKEVAAALSGPDDKAQQQRVIKTTKIMVTQTSALAKSAQLAAADPANRSQLLEFATALKASTIEFEAALNASSTASAAASSAAVSSDTVDPQVASSISAASNLVGVANIALIRASASLAQNKTSDQASGDLTKATVEVTEAIAQLIAAYASLNPGVQELIKLEDQIQKASGRVESAQIAVSTGHMDKPSDASKTHAQFIQHLVENAKSISEEVTNLAAAARETTPLLLVNAARQMGRTVGVLAVSTTDSASTANAAETQKQVLALSKELLDSLMQLARTAKSTNPTDERSLQALQARTNGTALVLSRMLGVLQSGVAIAQDLDRIIKEIKNAIASLATPFAVPTGKRFNDFREDIALMLSKDLTEQVNKITMADKNSVGELGLYSGRIGEGLGKWVSGVRGAAATTADKATAAKDIMGGGKDLLTALVTMLEQAKAVAQEPANPIFQQSLRNTGPAVFSNVAKLLGAIKRGALGEVMCDQAIELINKAVASIASSAIFAQAGQLEADQAAVKVPVTQLQSAIVSGATGPVTDSVVSVSKGTAISAEDVGKAALALANSFNDVSVATIRTASRINDANAQQALLGAAKMLGIRAHQYILAGRDFEKNRRDSTVQSSFATAETSMRDAIAHLVQVTETSAAEAAAGERQLESTKQQILALLKNVPGYDSALPADVVKSCREAAAVVADLVFATNQEELVVAGQKAAVCTEKVLNAGKAAARLSPDKAIEAEVNASTAAFAKSMCALLEVAKSSRQDPGAQAKVEDTSSETTAAIQGVVTALRKLPDSANLSLDEGSDLETLATTELQKCAKVIEEAAALLMKARPARKQKDPNIIDEETITDAILAAAIAITQATAVLVGAASTAQGEREKTLATPAGKKYRNDPTWANGLISASRGVAGSVKQLVSAANGAAQGKADQEVLIASARSVAASTTQLVTASRVKADPNSPAQINLGNAAKAVTGATGKLVSAAQSAAQWKEEAEAAMDDDLGFAGSTKAKFDQQIRILKLEAEIERERKRLATMNKKEYQN